MELNAIILVGVTVALVYGLQRLQHPVFKKVLDWIPAILFAYVIPAVVTHITGWDLSHVGLHSLSKEWIIPLAILTVMSALSFRQLRVIGWRPIGLFVGGSAVIALLPVVLVLLWSAVSPTAKALFLEQGLWKGLPTIVGSWIGGSTSQLVLKELVGCPEGLFLSILVLDNILVNIWTIVMFQWIQRSEQLNAFFGIADVIPDFIPNEIPAQHWHWRSLLPTILIGFAVILLTQWLVPSFLGKIIVLSLVGLALGNIITRWHHTLMLRVGGVLIVLIMAILGLKLNFDSLQMPLSMVGLVVIWLLGHFIAMLFIARVLRLHMAWVPIASMANLGGISTAPAVTAAYNEEWMPHAILLAILSMVSGTAWGMLTIWLMGMIGG